MLVLAGGQPRLIVLKPWMLKLIGFFDKNVGELLETYYMWDRPYQLDSSKFERKFGLLPTPLSVGLQETAAKFLDQDTKIANSLCQVCFKCAKDE
jgi:hypothetical protein